MSYDRKEIKRHIREQRVKKDGPALRELSDDVARKRLEKDIYLLLAKTANRDLFLKEIERLTARYGLRTGLEQKANALRLYDEYQRQTKNPSR
jgi:hypothetical protein